MQAGVFVKALAPVHGHGEIAQGQIGLDQGQRTRLGKALRKIARHQDRQITAAHDAGQRLDRLLDAESLSANSAYPVTAETTRWLALWMAFDDIIRVADLKSRASRWTRVTQEVKAKEGDVLKVYDHFKPGVPELAALLPQGLVKRLLRWDRARVTRGLAPWSMPLKVARHALWGMASLRLLASLRVLRPLGSRYATEQALIEEWLGGIEAASRLSPSKPKCGPHPSGSLARRGRPGARPGLAAARRARACRQGTTRVVDEESEAQKSLKHRSTHTPANSRSACGLGRPSTRPPPLMSWRSRR
jgi:hypothetical protein